MVEQTGAASRAGGKKLMPVLFIGHGSPMNAIEDNEFSQGWREMAASIPVPGAIVCISAHWETRGTVVTSAQWPPMIYDFYGFPRELFEVQYPAPGDPPLAEKIIAMLTSVKTERDEMRGFDHGCWSVMVKMYPGAAIPVVELSLNRPQPPAWHVALAKQLAPLREQGILILGSGNIVHNLGLLDWSEAIAGYDWAVAVNEHVKELLLQNNIERLCDYRALGDSAALAIPTPEHYLPVLYCAALRREGETLSFFNDKLVMGSLSMTSFRIG
jgi:4,5-DOPA dioxygenase extradiol